MSGSTLKRVLIVVFDALRPEFVTPELMPNLSAFAERGVHYRNSRSTFFTETRVNQSAVITGCMPHKHGIVANKFFDPALLPDNVLDTGDDVSLEAAFANANGPIFGVPTMGEILARAGCSYASLSAGTPGGGRLIHHTAEANGMFRLAMRRPEAASPGRVYERVRERCGDLPTYERPAIAWITHACDIYLDFVEPDLRPDVMLLWLCEPDETFHYHGIGSAPSLQTIAHVDAQFGRLLDHHRNAIQTGELQIVAMSDHGQITIEGDRLDIVARLNDAGFRAGQRPGADVDIVFAGANAGGLWVREGNSEIVSKVVDWLCSQNWCGPVLTRERISGALLLKDVRLDHPRAPDIAFAMAAHDGANAHGISGVSQHDAPYPSGGGSHGGLSRHELHNFLALGGADFKVSGDIQHLPAGNIDIMPTVLHLLGIDHRGDVDGRILVEALVGGPDEDSIHRDHQTLQSTHGHGRETRLSVTDVGETRYIHNAFVTALLSNNN